MYAEPYLGGSSTEANSVKGALSALPNASQALYIITIVSQYLLLKMTLKILNRRL